MDIQFMKDYYDLRYDAVITRKQMERIILWKRQLIRKNSLSIRRWKTS